MTQKPHEEEFSFKGLFVPLTTQKAISWIVVIGFVVFGNVLFNNFVWDDLTFILLNPDTHSLNLFHLFSGNMFNASGYYRPIPAVYFSVLYNLFGFNAFFYHFFQN